MAEATFLGTSTLTYTQYLDVDPEPGGTTLVAQPQTAYEIGLADGWQLGIPPQDGLWSVQAPAIGAGFNAVPGMAVAGNSSPGYSGGEGAGDDAVLGGAFGDALTPAAPVEAQFLGTSTRTYTQYLDTGGPGTTLVAEPLSTYQISIADQWQGLSGVPADGLWGPVNRPVLTFTITPGFAVIGGMSPGQPGFTADAGRLEDVLEEPAARTLAPSVRVMRGRRRNLPPPRKRRRSVARKRVTSGA